MSRLISSLMVAALAGTLASGAAFAQATTPPAGSAPHATTATPTTLPAKTARDRKATDAQAKVDPTAWDKTKDITRRQWFAAKKKWAQEKAQWKACNDQARKEKLRAPKSWSFVANCMTKS